MLPMEFRIWDNKEKRWRERLERLDGFQCALSIGMEGGVYELRKRDNMHTSMWENVPHDAGRYEVSQYTNIPTLQQQKIFGGDIITCSDFEGKTLPVEQYHGCWQVVSDDIGYGYLYALHGVVIIGNKWEGIGKQEPANLSGSSGDGTGQQQEGNCTIGVGDGTGQLFVHGNHESIKELQKKLLELEALRNLAGSSIDQQKAAESLEKDRKDREYFTATKSSLDWWKEYVRKPLLEGGDYTLAPKPHPDTIRKEEYSKHDNSPRQHEDLIWWRTNLRDKMLSFLDENVKEFAFGSISGVKPKWKHELLRAQELVEGILKCKRENKPPDIGLVTELNDIIYYKVHTLQGSIDPGTPNGASQETPNS